MGTGVQDSGQAGGGKQGESLMKVVKVALAGSPNTGKSTIFNALTGSHQRIGNWPGVTVEKMEGSYEWEGVTYQVVDLPGTYDFCAHTLDEKIARDYLLKEKPDVVVVVLNSCNLETNLYLLILVLEMGLRVVVALNMYDKACEQGLKIDYKRLGSILKVIVVPTVATRLIGIEELKKSITLAFNQPLPLPPVNYGEKVEGLLAEVEEAVKHFRLPYPTRQVALRLAENDGEMKEWLKQHDASGRVKMLLDSLKEIVQDPEKFFWEKRYGFSHGLVMECTSLESNRQARVDFTNRLDRILTHPWAGLVVFMFLMALVFEVVFQWSSPFQIFLARVFHLMARSAGFLLKSVNAPDWLISFFTDGFFNGVGSVVSFLPNIFLLFLFFAALEDSGYMARVAFITDPVMHRLGLHGRSAIPMVLGFGCNVPAILSTRTLESTRDRYLTILINPFMSCSARLPVYLLFCGVFFPRYQGAIVISLYLIGVVMAVLTARIFSWLCFKEETAPLIMELPPYNVPVLRNMLNSAWYRTLLFLRKAGTVILISMLVVWLLAWFPSGSEYASRHSFLGRFGAFLAPVLKPAGFGFWEAAVALTCGLVAKEAVIGVLGTLYGGAAGLNQVLGTVFTPVSAYSFLLMTLLYLPCLATIAAIKQEAGVKWAAVSAIWSLLVGWSAATIFYQLASLM